MDVEKFCATACAVTVLLMVWSTSSIAQSSPATENGRAVVNTDNEIAKGSLLNTEQLLNKNVIGTKGEKLGEVEQLVIDSTGQVRYGILQRGGFLNMGTKLYAIPWQALQTTANKDNYVLNISEEKLANAPSFERRNWPDFADAKLNRQVYSYYGYQWNPAAQPVAQSPGIPQGDASHGDFATLDANSDGYISKDEAQTADALSTNFDRADANQDGKLTPTEFSAFEAGQEQDNKPNNP